MLTRHRTLVVSCVAASLVLIAGPGMADGGTGSPGAQSSVDEIDASAEPPARELVAFLLLGTGPLMDTHRALASELGIQAQDIPDEAIDALLEALFAVDPRLADTLRPLGSGDPVLVHSALGKLRGSLAEVFAGDAVNALSEVADGRGWVWNVNHAVTYYVSIGFIAVAAVTAAVPLVLFSSDGDGRYDQELFALRIAERL